MGPTWLRTLATGARGADRHQHRRTWCPTPCPSSNGCETASRREVFVIGFSFGGSDRGLRRRTATGSRRDAGGGRNGHRRCGRRAPMPTTLRSTTAVERGKRRAHPAARGHRTAPAPRAASSSRPGSAGPATSGASRPTSRTAPWPGNCSTSMVRSPDYSVGDIIRTLRGIGATQAALLSDLARMDLTRSVTRLEVPVVLVQGRLDQVAPGEATRAVRQLSGGTQQAAGVVREISPHTASGRARQVPRSPHASPSQGICNHVTLPARMTGSTPQTMSLACSTQGCDGLVRDWEHLDLAFSIRAGRRVAQAPSLDI